MKKFIISWVQSVYYIQAQRLLKPQGFAGICYNPKIGTDMAEIPKMKLKSMTNGLCLPSLLINVFNKIIPTIVPRIQKLPTQIP